MAQSNAVATRDNNPAANDKKAMVRKTLTQLDDMGAQFAAALPAHIPVERFARVVRTAIQNNPDLAVKCSPASLWNAAMRAAQDGLLPDGREGAIVEYKGQAQWMPMIGGIRKKVRNSGEIKTWDVHAVYKNDAFEFELGDDPFVKHRPALSDRGPLIAVYSIAKLKGGEKSFDVMGIEDVEKIRKISRAQNGPWSNPTFYPEMAKKTVARRHSKVLPMSSDLDDLIRRDDHLYDMEGASDQATKPRLGLGAKLAALASPDPIIDEGGETIDAETGEVQAEGSGEKSPQTAQETEKPSAATSAPAEGGSAAGDAPAGEEQGSAAASDEQDDDGDAPPEFSAAEIDAAFDRGAAAKREGRSRKATPPEWREPGKEKLIAAWLDGFDRTERPQQ